MSWGLTQLPRRVRVARRGVEAVEAAFSLPLIILILFPVLHICHNWHNEKMLKFAAFEAAKVVGSPNGSISEARQIFEEYTNAFGIKDAELEFEPLNYANLVPDTPFWVRGSAPMRGNKLALPLNLSFSNRLRSGQVIYRKEG